MRKTMTPEEIVSLIGNIANRKDIRDTQAQQVKEIKKLMKAQKEALGKREPCCKYCACPCHS
jgi:hypothetical protein